MAMDENLLARAGYKGPRWRVDPSIYGDVPVFNTPVQSVNVPPPLPVQPPTLFFAPHQEDDGGWAGALGQIGGNLLSRILARRSASPADGSHTSEGHTHEPIIQPHYDSSGAGGEHEMGFARGGVIDDSMVGRRLKFGEAEPEAVVDEAGRVQVITKPTVGTPTRPALVVPFSQLKQAAAALGQELPAPDYREVYSGPRWNPSQFEQVDGATRSSLAGIGGQSPSAVVQNALQNSGPRWPGGLDLTSATPVGQKPLPQSAEPMSAGFKTSAVSPGLALSRDDGHDINQFASPDVRATLDQKSDYGSPAGLGQRVPRWPAADEQTTQSQVPQQSPATSDASTLPVDERRTSIFDAGNETQSTSSQQSPSSSLQQSATTARRAQLERELATLYGLEGEKVRDKNGRLKSGLLGALRGFLQGVAQTGSLAGGLGGAISGGVVGGVVHPAWDEEMKQVAAISKQRDKVAQALAIEKELTQLDGLDARAAALQQKNSPDKTRAQMFRELTQRIRIGGGHLNPADPEQARLMHDLNITATRGGGGFNPQRVKVIRGADGQDRLVYLDFKDGAIAPRYLDVEGNAGAPLSERDRKLLAIELERENRERALDGLPPLKFDDDAPSTYTGPKPPSENTQTPQTAPTSTTSQPPAQSTSPVLVPSGAQPEKVSPVFGNRRHAGSYRGNRAARGGSRRDEIGASLEARDTARYQQEAVNARAQAAAARSRGEDDVANSWEQAARVADENARKVGTRRGGRQSTPQPKKNDPLGILDQR